MVKVNRRVLQGLSVVAATAMLVLGAPAPSGAIVFDDPVNADALVLVPTSGGTVKILRNGNVVTRTVFAAARSFEGNFTAATGTDVFFYNPGSGPDGILHVTPSGETVTTTFTSRPVNGTFQPIVGDYDGNGLDDVFWYAAGSAPDALWLSKAAGGYANVAVNVSGTFRPLAMHTDAGAYEDIIWYAPGTAPDSIWRFGPGGSHTTASLSISGDYQLVPGFYTTDSINALERGLYFYNKAGADSVWRFRKDGSHSTQATPNIDGSVQIVVGNFVHSAYDQLYFYRGGPPEESLLGFTDGGDPQLLDAPNASGNYRLVLGNFNGDPYDDIAFTSSGKVSTWYFDGDTHEVRNATTPTDVVGRVAYRYPLRKK